MGNLDIPTSKGEIQYIGSNTFEVTFDVDAKIEIGDKTQETKFVPSIKLYKWDDAYFELTWPTTEIKTPGLVDNILEWITPDYTLRFYPKDKAVQMEEGGLEFEIVLNKTFVGDKIELDYKSENLIFLKQLAYSSQPDAPEDIAAGVVTKTETQGLDIDGKVIVDMPENVIDSYAVYHLSKKDGRYKTGKAFHIWRLKAIDSKANEVWCDVNIDEKVNKFVIYLPKGFLDTAVYPITIDPTFGYTTLGGTAYASDSTCIGYSATPAAGRIISMHTGLNSNWTAGDKTSMALYTTGGNLQYPITEEKSEGHAATAFVKFKPRGGVLITAQSYAIVNARNGCSIMRDAGPGGNSRSFSQNVISQRYWPNSVTFSTSDLFYSTYARYADSSGEGYGQPTNIGVSQSFTDARYIGGTTPDCDHMYVDTLYYRALGSGTITIALYTGGTVGDPTGATRIAYAANVSVVAGWNSISVTKVKLPKNSIFWIGFANGSGAEPYASSSSADAGDFQTANGRWAQTSPADYDETTPLPTNPGAGSFSNFWYNVYALIEIEEEVYSNWAHTKKLFIDTTLSGANVSGTVSNFPLLVRLNTSNFNFSQCLSDGSCVRFSTSAGAKLWFEIERWDSVNKLAEFWVYVPSIVGNNKTQYINIHWGKSDAENLSYSFNVFRRGDGYVGVWHLNNSFLDATDNNYNGTNNGSADIIGVIARGRDFVRAESDYITHATPHVLNDVANTDHEFSMWCDVDDISAPNPGTAKRILEARYDNANHLAYTLLYPNGDLSVSVTKYVFLGSEQKTRTVDSSISADVQYFVSHYWQEATSTLKFFLNAVEQTKVGPTNIGPGSQQKFDLGRRTDGDAATYFDGMIDEVRFCRIPKSLDQRKLRYMTERADQFCVYFSMMDKIQSGLVNSSLTKKGLSQ